MHFKREKRTCILQVSDCLSNTFWNTWIFAWFFISLQCTKDIANAHDLWQRIYEAAQALAPNMLHDVFTSTVKRWEECFEMDEGRLSYIDVLHTSSTITYLNSLTLAKSFLLIDLEFWITLYILMK
jgi:hypothetical protein